MAKYYSYQLRLQVPQGHEADLLKFLREQEENPLFPARRRIMLALSSFWTTEAQIAKGAAGRDEAEESILMLMQQVQEIAEQAGIDLDSIDIPGVTQRLLDRTRSQSKRSPRQTSRISRKRPPSEESDWAEDATSPPPEVTAPATSRGRSRKEEMEVADPEPVKSATGNGTTPLNGVRKKLF